MVNRPQPIHNEPSWPPADLEPVSACPFCVSEARTATYKNVQDWSFGTDCAPRLGGLRWGGWLFKMLQPGITVPFGWRQVAERSRGRLIEVRCRNGDTLQGAEQLGWQALG